MTYEDNIEFLARNMVPSWVISKDEENTGVRLVAKMWATPTEDVVEDVWKAYKLILRDES